MKLQLLKARLQGMTESLSQSSNKAKNDSVSWSLASDFNTIIKDIGEQYPDAKESLPGIIRQRQLSVATHLSEITFLDLEAKVAQAIKIIEVLESGQ